ncbi:hypothetical protein CMQ_2088 [Grosmannia clavigera kw1407]|uniref:Ubiquinol-cytochrome-c reductase cytochrome c1 n=1 Tax=Grosmannia clavigera (strain kw1407 / UAMH 11150) TaxID=655863 RepID=F0XJJ3_GROCL|nr:uncharacterized protein CMQ_2088 [Grosmannia clavigera kw1407]EFX02039.1 hypothetical protein CMQ_2088 [Grosmannia clavigera kw1407]
MPPILRTTPSFVYKIQGHRLAAYSSSNKDAVKMKNDKMNTNIQTAQQHLQTVYLACRTIFSGPHANIRNRRTVAKHLTPAKATSHPLLKGMDATALTDSAESLLRQGVFADETLAKNMFPDVFEAAASVSPGDKTASVDTMASSHKVQSAGRGGQIKTREKTTNIKAQEVDEKIGKLAVMGALPTPAKPSAGKLEETTVKFTTLAGNDEGTGNRVVAGKPQLSSTTGIKATAMQVATQVSLNSIDDSQSVNRSTSQRKSLVEKYPTLATGTFPYQAQHAVLTRTQQLLEDCFYDFARKHFPDLMKARNWDSAACVELSECTKIFQKPGQERSKLRNTDEVADGEQLDEVLHAMNTIRNSTVHRNLHPARGLSWLMKKAVQFTEITQDNARAERLVEVHTVVEDLLTQMETRENELDAWMSGAMHEIQEKRGWLDTMEADLWRQMHARDKKSRHYTQECLKAAALDIFEKPMKKIEQVKGQEASVTAHHKISRAQEQTPVNKPWSLVNFLRSKNPFL